MIARGGREGWALAADPLGLSAAVEGRLVRLPALPGSVAVAAVLVDNQPRCDTWRRAGCRG